MSLLKYQEDLAILYTINKSKITNQKTYSATEMSNLITMSYCEVIKAFVVDPGERTEMISYSINEDIVLNYTPGGGGTSGQNPEYIISDMKINVLPEELYYFIPGKGGKGGKGGNKPNKSYTSVNLDTFKSLKGSDGSSGELGGDSCVYKINNKIKVSQSVSYSSNESKGGLGGYYGYVEGTKTHKTDFSIILGGRGGNGGLSTSINTNAGKGGYSGLSTVIPPNYFREIISQRHILEQLI